MEDFQKAAARTAVVIMIFPSRFSFSFWIFSLLFYFDQVETLKDGKYLSLSTYRVYQVKSIAEYLCSITLHNALPDY